jgi:cytochrome c-type biogenesis protein CcmH
MEDSGTNAPAAMTSRPKIVGALVIATVMVLAGWVVMASDGWNFPEEPASGEEGSAYLVSAVSPQALREKTELPAIAMKLKTRLDEKPEDPDGWALLARTYSRLGQYEEAKIAFQTSLKHRPSDAYVLADYADTLAYLNNGTFGSEGREAINKALQIDPQNTSALMLAGLAAYDRTDYKIAILHWEKLATLLKSGSPHRAQVERALNEARKQAASGMVS